MRVAFPASWALVTVIGSYLRPDGTPALGTVAFTAPGPIHTTAEHTFVTPRPIVATLDATGSFSVQVPASTDPGISPTGWAYEVREAIDRQVRIYAVKVSSPGPLYLADLAPLQLTANALPVVTHVNAMSGDVILTASSVGAVPATGGSMSGPLTLAADPAAPLEAATKQYVDDTALAGRSFTWAQLTPAATWVIVHNLGRRPTVALATPDGDEFDGLITWVDENTVVVSLAAETAGYAYLT
jgi:hypothetical protein